MCQLLPRAFSILMESKPGLYLYQGSIFTKALSLSRFLQANRLSAVLENALTSIRSAADGITGGLSRPLQSFSASESAFESAPPSGVFSDNAADHEFEIFNDDRWVIQPVGGRVAFKSLKSYGNIFQSAAVVREPALWILHRKSIKTPCTLCSAVAYCCGAVALLRYRCPPWAFPP